MLAIEEHARKTAFMNTMTQKSGMSEDHIMAFDHRVKAGIQEHYKSKVSRGSADPGSDDPGRAPGLTRLQKTRCQSAVQAEDTAGRAPARETDGYRP